MDYKCMELVATEVRSNYKKSYVWRFGSDSSESNCIEKDQGHVSAIDFYRKAIHTKSLWLNGYHSRNSTKMIPVCFLRRQNIH